jgi:hypothetical protein
MLTSKMTADAWEVKIVNHAYLLGTSGYRLRTSCIEGLNEHIAESQYQPSKQHTTTQSDDLQSGGRSFCTETVGPIAFSSVLRLSALN